jgi:hypothetical protein
MSSIDRTGSDPDALETHTGTLGETLGTCRSAADTAALARTLLWYETAGRELVGLTQDCSRAYYYRTASETFVTVAFDERTIRRTGEETIRRRLRDVEPWVRHNVDDLAWIHPRYRQSDRRAGPN